MSNEQNVKSATERESSPKFSVSFEDEIRYRAYELYQQRGGEEGHEVDDWLQAEEEINRKRGNRRAA